MRDYAKVSPQFWIGTTGKALRMAGHEAQIVALYLLTNPHANMLGLYYLPKLFLAHETGLSIEGATKGLARCIDVQFCSYDAQTEIVWVHQMAAYQIGEQLSENDKRCIGIQNEYDSLPENPFLQAFFERYATAFHMRKARLVTPEIPSPTEAPCKSHRSQEQEQEQKTEQEQEQKVPTEPVAQKRATEPGPVEKVFTHWQEVHRKPRARLDDKRRAVIRKALKHYSEADLCQSISGYLNSPHHMGQNPAATVYDSIELFLRDSQHIDAGLKFYTEPPRTDLSPKTRAIVAQTEGWIPPESRHASN